MKTSENKIARELVVSSSTNKLSEIRDFISSVAKESGFNEEDVGKIILAVDEACTNVIKHAYGESSTKGKIYLSVNFASNKLTIVIVDRGLHFEPGKIPEPDLEKYYKEKRKGGFGMFLMRKLMDEVNYDSFDDGKNRVTLSKYLHN